MFFKTALPASKKLKDLEKTFKDCFDKSQPLKKLPRFKKNGIGDSFRYLQGFKVSFLFGFLQKCLKRTDIDVITLYHQTLMFRNPIGLMYDAVPHTDGYIYLSYKHLIFADNSKFYFNYSNKNLKGYKYFSLGFPGLNIYNNSTMRVFNVISPLYNSDAHWPQRLNDYIRREEYYINKLKENLREKLGYPLHDPWNVDYGPYKYHTAIDYTYASKYDYFEWINDISKSSLLYSESLRKGLLSDLCTKGSKDKKIGFYKANRKSEVIHFQRRIIDLISNKHKNSNNKLKSKL